MTAQAAFPVIEIINRDEEDIRRALRPERGEGKGNQRQQDATTEKGSGGVKG
jgi:hypothetical protein